MRTERLHTGIRSKAMQCSEKWLPAGIRLAKSEELQVVFLHSLARRKHLSTLLILMSVAVVPLCRVSANAKITHFDATHGVA
jgi:hypothetical protein